MLLPVNNLKRYVTLRYGMLDRVTSLCFCYLYETPLSTSCNIFRFSIQLCIVFLVDAFRLADHVCE